MERDEQCSHRCHAQGHTLKNPKTQIYQHIAGIPATLCLIITGTPIQNKLAELYALFGLCNPVRLSGWHWASCRPGSAVTMTYHVCKHNAMDTTTHTTLFHQGLLGDHRWFRDYFERPITQGQDKGATAREAHHGNAKAAELRRITAPYLLRREKQTVLGSKKDTDEALHSTTTRDDAPEGSSKGADGSASSQVDGTRTSSAQRGSSAQRLGRKNDLIVWLELHPLQRAIYEVRWMMPCCALLGVSSGVSGESRGEAGAQRERLCTGRHHRAEKSVRPPGAAQPTSHRHVAAHGYEDMAL